LIFSNSSSNTKNNGFYRSQARVSNLFFNKFSTLSTEEPHFVPKSGEARDKATDQLLNAIYVITHEDSPQDEEKKEAIRDLLMKSLTEIE
jgi:hypothetical protein